MVYAFSHYMIDLRVLEKMACSASEKRALLPLVGRFVALAEQARRDGILALEPELDSDMPPIMKRGLRLAVDGTDPDFIWKTLYYYAVCGGAEGAGLLRNLIVMEGVMAIQRGDNPRNVKEALAALLGDDFIVETGKYFAEEHEEVRLGREVVAWLSANVGKEAREGHALLEKPFAMMFPAGVQAVLRETERDELAVALVGAGWKPVATVLRSMTTRAGAALIKDMERYDTASDTCITRAQEKVMELVRRLQETGEVYLPKDV